MPPQGVRAIAPGFLFIQRGWLNGNHFLVAPPPGDRDEGFTLIDTGSAPHAESTLALLAKSGAAAGALRRVILTHAHCDHSGGVKAIQDVSAAEVWLHPISRHHVDQRNDWATWWRYYDQPAAFFQTHQDLAEGAEIRLGGLDFQVIHAPGHAAGQICLFAPRPRLLISADAWWENGLGVLTPRIEGMDCAHRALETLRRLRDLDPVVVYPGHGAPFDDIAASFERVKARLELFIAEPRQQGLDQIRKIIAYTLLLKGGAPASSLFNNLQEMPWFGETIALFFGKERPRPIFDQVIDSLLVQGAIKAEGSFLTATAPA